MRAEEALLEFGWHVLGHGGNGDAGGVGADNGMRGKIWFQFLKKVLLDLQIFNDRLDDPVCFSDPLYVVFKIAGSNELRIFFGIKGGRLGF